MKQTTNLSRKPGSWFLTILFLFSAAMFLTQCKKGDNPSNAAQGKYYVRFKANGVQQEYRSDFRVSASASDVPAHPFGNNIDTYAFAMDGYGDTTLAYPDIQFQIRAPKPLKIDSVYKTIPRSSSKDGEVYLFYVEKVTTFEKYMSYGSSENVQIRFTERTGTYIKGTFSGTVYAATNATKMEITQGEFYAARAN